MPRHRTEHDLEPYWSFSSEEFKLLPQRDASGRLGVAASLKFFQLEGSLPSSGRDIPAVALHYMAKQLDIAPNVIAAYDWQGRTGNRYRGRLRTALGIRPVTAEDCKAVETWLHEEVVPWDHPPRHLQDAVLRWYRSRQIEPPTAGQIERLVRSAIRMHEATIYEETVAKLVPSVNYKSKCKSLHGKSMA
jgi:hypothetical protein